MSRFGKPIVMALITLFAVHFLTNSWLISLALAAVPFIFGLLNIYTDVGYAVTALSVLAAVAWVVMPLNMRQQVMAAASNVTESVLHPASGAGDRSLARTNTH